MLGKTVAPLSRQSSLAVRAILWACETAWEGFPFELLTARAFAHAFHGFLSGPAGKQVPLLLPRSAAYKLASRKGNDVGLLVEPSRPIRASPGSLATHGSNATGSTPC